MRLLFIYHVIILFLTNKFSYAKLNDSLTQDDIIHLLKCQNTNLKCNQLPYECFTCNISKSSANCAYGDMLETNCTIKNFTKCDGDSTFSMSYECRFCYQTPEWMHICVPNTTCKYNHRNRMFKTNCTIKNTYQCLGSRYFYKKIPCNWTSGYSWSYTMMLSIFLGGFGVDRFYLGYYKEGIGKLLSFGGLGIWSLIDCLLIYTSYIGPQDGSLYI